MSTEQQPNPGSSRKASSLVIAGRLILLLLAAVATVSAFVISRGRGHGASGSAELYVCPMHPEAKSSSPGECPICRMALEPVGTSNRGASAPVLGTVKRRVIALEVRAPAWIDAAGVVTAVLYKHDLAGLSPGERGSFFRAGSPTVGIDVRLTTEPPAPWDGSTSRVRFRLGGPEPRPGRVVHALGEPGVGWVKLAAKPRELLVVPSNAVLYSTEGPYVLVAATDGDTFSTRRVEIGRVYRGHAVVLSGLREEEPIVTANAFFLDAERRLQSQRGDTVGGRQ